MGWNYRVAQGHVDGEHRKPGIVRYRLGADAQEPTESESHEQ